MSKKMMEELRAMIQEIIHQENEPIENRLTKLESLVEKKGDNAIISTNHASLILNRKMDTILASQPQGEQHFSRPIVGEILFKINCELHAPKSEDPALAPASAGIPR